jgi:hypothetical protein
MLVFIRNVPEGTCLRDIVNFINPALRGGLFAPKGVILSVNALEVREEGTGALEHHAIVHIKPDAAALRAMKKLNGRFFKGKRAHLHEFVVRNWKNDRRGSSNSRLAGAERRMAETRRRKVQVKMGRFMVTSGMVAEGDCSLLVSPKPDE